MSDGTNHDERNLGRTAGGWRWWLLGAALIAAAGAFWWWTRPPASPSQTPSLALAPTTDAPPFARAFEPREIKLPQDHGPHPDYRTEWWYYTGNVQAEDGRRFAYQLTFFRRALSPLAVQKQAELAANQVYFGHFAVADVADREHIEWMRISRGVEELAGAQADPFRVWLEAWSARGLNADGSRVRLVAEEEGRAIDLSLESEKPLVAHGDQGLSVKSQQPGNASYYVSYTRMGTRGQMRWNDETVNVEGLSWFDHEWSTSALGPQGEGWDWFSLQLNDGYELMYYRLRRKDGSIEPVSSGTLVRPDGSTAKFTWREVELTELDTWTSPDSGARYPQGWRMRLPSLELDLTVTPWFNDQEMNVNVVYWEGAVRVEGQHGGRQVSGSGFVELTGYAESIQGSF